MENFWSHIQVEPFTDVMCAKGATEPEVEMPGFGARNVLHSRAAPRCVCVGIANVFWSHVQIEPIT